MLKLVSKKIDTYLTSLWRHERYLFSVFRGIYPAIYRRFSKKVSTSVVEHQKIFSQVIKINKRQILLKHHLESYFCRKKNDGMSARNSYITYK
jgi:hypothetical protein